MKSADAESAGRLPGVNASDIFATAAKGSYGGSVDCNTRKSGDAGGDGRRTKGHK
jgi:hypothetical protein